MMVIGFFRDLLSSLGGVVSFVSSPLNSQLPDTFQLEVIGDMSILQMFSVSLVATLVIFLTIHIVRLFVGG